MPQSNETPSEDMVGVNVPMGDTCYFSLDYWSSRDIEPPGWAITYCDDNPVQFQTVDEAQGYFDAECALHTYCSVEAELAATADGVNNYWDRYHFIAKVSQCPSDWSGHAVASGGCAPVPDDEGNCPAGYSNFGGACAQQYTEPADPEDSSSCPTGYEYGSVQGVAVCVISVSTIDNQPAGCAEITNGQLTDQCVDPNVAGDGDHEVPPFGQVNVNSDGTATTATGAEYYVCDDPNVASYGAIGYSHCDFVAEACSAGYIYMQNTGCVEIYNVTAVPDGTPQTVESTTDPDTGATTCPTGYSGTYQNGSLVCSYVTSGSGTTGDSGTGTGSGTGTTIDGEGLADALVEAAGTIGTAPTLENTDSWWISNYPNGLEGIWATRQADLMASSMVSWLYSFAFPDTGSCPTFTLDLSALGFGTQTLMADYCYIWSILRAIFILSAIFAARRIIFGG